MSGASAAPAPATPPPAVPFRGSGPFLAKAPDLSLPMRHFAFAALAFWVFSWAFFLGAGRFIGFDFQARWVLGLTHTLTLGWVTMTILGAFCQLAPVLWEVPLASPGLVKAAWWLFAGGLSLFVGQLWADAPVYWAGPACAATAVCLYLYALVRTMTSPGAKLDWTARHLQLAVGYLAAVATLGLLLAFDRDRGLLFHDPDGALIAHVHLALVGFVSITIMGVSYRLVSMFSLSHMESRTPGRLALVLVNVGLVGLTLDALFFGRRLMPLWAVLLAAGYLAYAAQMRRLFASRLRKIDPALAFTLLALAGGLAWSALGVGLATGLIADTTEHRAAYVFCALVGWVTPFILGQIHKIVPFLIWLHVYSPRNWKPPVAVPKIQDLTSERLAWLELASLAGAIPLGVAGFLAGSPALLRAAGALLVCASSLYVFNTAATLRHLTRRDPRWTVPNTSPKSA